MAKKTKSEKPKDDVPKGEEETSKPTRSTEKRRRSTWKIALPVVIVLALVSYIAFSNMAPLGAHYVYTIDVGAANDTTGVAKITGPFDRIDERLVDNDLYSKTGEILNYREINKNLVYFEVADPIANDGRVNVDVQVRFKDTLPANGKMRLGAKNGAEWNYSWGDVYVPLYEQVKAGSKILYVVNDSGGFDALNISESSAVGTFNLPFKVDASSRIDGYDNSGAISVFNNSIRGAHTFYTYVGSDGALELEVTKQDMNWYNNSDDLVVEAYDNSGALVANMTIPDDGVTGNTSVRDQRQTRTLKVTNLTEGVYRLELKNNADLTIEQIITPQSKLVSKKIFMIDNGTIYLNSPVPTKVSFQTYHKTGLQNVTIDGMAVNVNNVSKVFESSVGAGSHVINAPKGDMIVSSDGYLSFNAASWFSPFRYAITNVKSESDLAGLDAVVANFGNYTFAKKEGGWVTVGASWKASDLFVKDNKLGFVISLPHLGKNATANLTVPLDWIKIKLTKPAL